MRRHFPHGDRPYREALGTCVPSWCPTQGGRAQPHIPASAAPVSWRSRATPRKSAPPNLCTPCSTEKKFKIVQGATSALNAAPLPALGNRYRGPALEPEYESGGEAHVVLCLRARRSHAESRHQVLRLNGTNGEVIKQLVIHAAAHAHGESIL